MTTKTCPCHSGRPYPLCCQPYHQGRLPEDALRLMRSRYAAYALGLAEYIIATTHPHNPAYLRNHAQWKEQILEFSQATYFKGLTIIDFWEEGARATVTFHAELHQGTQDASFTEKSYFSREGERWLYERGEIKKISNGIDRGESAIPSL